MKLNYNPWLKVNYLFLCFAYLFRLSHGTDRITANYSISGDQTIVSQPEGIFELGFFNPSGNSSKYYIGIWYKKISLQTVVWVANRENPVIDKHSCELKIMNGNLVLTNGSKSPVWSSNLTSTKSDSINAVLLDSGNLVIRDGSERNQKPLWQSFDEPTNTWLPGGKLIYDKRGRKPQRLISWKNQDDPARGLFSLELVPTTKEYVIKWNLTRQFWTSGAWDDQERIFSLVPEMRLNYIYNFSYIDNSNESYFTYSVYHSSFISRFVMDISGQVKQLTWLEETQQWNLFWSNPKQQCQVYAYCGAFGSCNQNSLPFCTCLKGFKPKSEGDWGLSDYSRGCERKTDLQCERPNSQKKRDRFFPYNNLVLPQNDTKLNAGTIEECEAACSKNCSCYAYAYDGSGCSAWHEDLLNIQQLSDGDTSGKTLYLRLAASEFTKKKNKNLVIGVVVGSIIVTLALFCLVFGLLWRQKYRSVGSSNKGVEGSLISFGYRELQHATKNFSDKLGGGGFGSVFKGTLPDSSVIAVKKLESFSQGEKQFRTEVSTIGTIQHVNLVRLRGFCSEGTKKLLVYDYMPNGSLEAHLFPEKSSNLLDWKTRYQIALGTARGLTYLHEKCRDCIIHCDIKPENILLDAEFCPKVADFGLAKLVGRDFSRVLTTMRGTRGYLAPEWISGVAITAKADVFSYGMMLFELISGHRNTEQSVYGTVKFFPTWAASKVAEGAEIMSILDPRLEGNADEEEVKKICKLACWCIQDNEIQRPSMGQVVQIIEGVLDVNMPPMPRSLQVFVEEQDNIMFYTESSSAQSSQSRNTSSSAQSSQTRNTSSSAQSSQTRNTPTASSSSISKNSVSTMSNNNAVE
ncbi:G-type lectin S-receptor-like serine/threonine-protein kinase At2g19130 [Chenopodium quinoa]|uniref:Receptor-like serine/threonine-protein kinase n=1 Tax=Chenopodium quinoa TaxID=63459 RepID=A0A803MR23_CHEQI|nr:G-type lectin S-receptor-like serine/threonine-protein kinase At2g19130 [Chenopodium quinoa]